MAVKIRLRRFGAKKQPVYRLVVAEHSFPLQGRVVEEIGFYNPRSNPPLVQVDREKIAAWQKKGARLTGRVARIIKKSAQE